MPTLIDIANDTADILGLEPVASTSGGDGALIAARIPKEATTALSTHNWNWAARVTDLGDAIGRKTEYSSQIEYPVQGGTASTFGPFADTPELADAAALALREGATLTGTRFDRVNIPASPINSDWVVRPKPVGMLRLRGIFLKDTTFFRPIVDYRINSQGIHCRTGELKADYVVEQDIQDWPLEFGRGVAALVASQLANRLRPDRAQIAEREAYERMETARQSDDADRGRAAVLLETGDYLNVRGFWQDAAGTNSIYGPGNI